MYGGDRDRERQREQEHVGVVALSFENTFGARVACVVEVLGVNVSGMRPYSWSNDGHQRRAGET